MAFEIKCFTNKMLIDGEDGGQIPFAHKNFLLSNPFALIDDSILMQALSGKTVIGSVYAYPLEIIHKSNRIFKVCAGSTLYVNPESRGMGIGGRLTMERLQLTRDKIAIAAGLSGMSLPIFQKKGFDVFFLKRYIFLQNSRPVVEMFF